MSYQIIQKFIKGNHSNDRLNAQGVVVHETADSGATDENEFNYFNGGDRQASAHAFVDWDSITQIVPWNETAWHAGKTANHRFIGVELCRPSKHDPEKFKEVWNRGVWLFAYLFITVVKQTKITKDNLMSHAEVSNKWHETNHQDPIAYFKEYGKTVDDFRSEIQKAIDSIINPPKPKPIIKPTPTPTPIVPPKKPSVIVEVINKVTPKKNVKIVNVSAVNFREKPDGKILLVLKRGTKVDLISEKNGWSQVKYGGKIGFMATKFLK